jgi:hypothetical protein
MNELGTEGKKKGGEEKKRILLAPVSLAPFALFPSLSGAPSLVLPHLSYLHHWQSARRGCPEERTGATVCASATRVSGRFAWTKTSTNRPLLWLYLFGVVLATRDLELAQKVAQSLSLRLQVL